MHTTQKKILKIIEKKDISKMTLRELGELINEDHPQKVKHHLNQLIRKGFVRVDKKQRIIGKIERGLIRGTSFVNVPILGSSSCGEPRTFAEENFEGYLKISKKLLKKIQGIFALKADGSSMNKSNIDGKTLEDGDFAIIDSENKSPQNGDYVLSIIDGCSNIKRFFQDTKNKQIILLSESSLNLPPIYIHPEDFLDYMVGGKVIQVIKKPGKDKK